MHMKQVLGLCAMLVVSIAARAQAPSADWRTITTPHFRVHYPAEYETWSVRAASRLESIRAAVVNEVGYDPAQTIDVVIANPVADPNGIAWPVLGAPRMIFYTEAPGPDEPIGAFSNWIDLLAVHEVTHIVHMLRPSRNPLRHLAEELVLPIGPITWAGPRWVLEGYATVVEGRLTGAGRPTSTLRALILRTWAANGRIPSYDRLDDDDRFLGMSMAYLAGSAYLEWLEQRNGPGSLRNLWRRMTARRSRSFNEAFTGVFGDSPEKLYGVFSAELAASATTLRRAAPMHEGELWQVTARASGEPAVSPDGSRIAVILRSRTKPAKLVVWNTGPNDEAERKYEKRIGKILARDPEDVAPLRTKPLPRDPVDSYRAPDGGDLATPRWLRDGSAIVFSHRQPDSRGFLHHDLFAWTPDRGGSRRITHLADVADADPFPDGRSAIAVRQRHGFTQLVRVDLQSGAVTPVTEAALDVISHPRVNGDGTRVAYVAHRGGSWSLVVRDLTTGTETATTGSDFAWPEWSRTDPHAIYASVSSGGFAEIHRLDSAAPGSVLGSVPGAITRSSGGAFQPAPSPDGRLFFMSLEPDGFVVRVITDDENLPLPPLPPPFDPMLVPAIPPRALNAPSLESANVANGRPYGIGRQELSWIAGYNVAASESAAEIGARLGDVVGRLDTLVIGSLGRDQGQRGGALIAAWRGWPVEISGQLFTAGDDRVKRAGLEVRAGWERRAPRTFLRLEGGGLSGKPFDLAFGSAQFRVRQMLGSWRSSATVETSAETGTMTHFRAAVSGSVSRGATRLLVRYQRDVARNPGHAGELLEVGGLPSSIVPHAAFANRLFEPALAARSLTGERYQGLRAEATLPVLPLGVFYQQHRMDTGRRTLAGVTLSLRSDPSPILRVPGLDVTLGAARPIDGTADNDINWWFGMRWRP